MIKKFIKNILLSRKMPEPIFQLYSSRKEKRKRKLLFELLDRNEDLMSGVPENQREHWNMRIEKVISAPENENIVRVKDAGKIIGSYLIMHNGIAIDPLSYYSFPLIKMLMKNKGVHEPEEERIFQEVIDSINDSKPRTMLELGSYWSFYSLWFQKKFPFARNIMVEPDRKNLLYGKRNFQINNCKGKFMHSGIGKDHQPAMNVTTVDEICKRNAIDFIDILHSDIQGFELEMLQGCTKMLSIDKIGYIFISTHSNELHQQCAEVLMNYNYEEVANLDLDQSSSWDGILVMKSPNYEGIAHVDIST